MEDTQVIDVLYVALSEVKTYSGLLSFEVEGIKGFGLCFGDWRDIMGTWECLEPCERSSSVLDDHLFGRGGGRRLVVEKGT